MFKADLPGLKEEVTVQVEDGRVLQISGERSKEEEKNDTWHLMERSGKFLLWFRLPENADVDQVKTSLENGVLNVTVPKKEIKRPQVKSVEIAGRATRWSILTTNPYQSLMIREENAATVGSGVEYLGKDWDKFFVEDYA